MRVKIGAPGVTGTFGCPDGDGPFPAVLALGGSDGGTPEYFLNLLVPEGSRSWRSSTGVLARLS